MKLEDAAENVEHGIGAEPMRRIRLIPKVDGNRQRHNGYRASMTTFAWTLNNTDETQHTYRLAMSKSPTHLPEYPSTRTY